MAWILLIEDDATIVEGLSNALKFHGFEVLSAKTGEKGWEEFQQNSPDLVILDVLLPGVNGFEVCRKIRQRNKQVPVIMLTAKTQESDKLLGFELGVDDYVTKPFSANELLARIHAVLKRSRLATGKQEQPAVKIGTSVVDFNQFLVKRGDQDMPLSPKELEILKLLARQAGTVVSRDRLIDEIWGDEYFPSPKTIDNFILKLRQKIEPDPKNPRYLLTIHGAGYKLKL